MCSKLLPSWIATTSAICGAILGACFYIAHPQGPCYVSAHLVRTGKMSDRIGKFFRNESGKANQELGSVIAFSMIILSVAGGICYGLQHGMLNKLNEHSSYVASHANQHMY